jgi:hypothetical protein
LGVGFMGFASYGSNFFLELLALKYDLPVAWDRDFRQVLCILDSLEVYFFIFLLTWMFGPACMYLD